MAVFKARDDLIDNLIHERKIPWSPYREQLNAAEHSFCPFHKLLLQSQWTDHAAKVQILSELNETIKRAKARDLYGGGRILDPFRKKEVRDPDGGANVGLRN